MVAWIRSEGLVDYDAALAWMQERAKAIAAGTADEAIWLLEHPPLYTAGTSAKRDDLKDPYRFPVFDTRRGGQYTYHGPGQRVVYVMLDLNRRGRDVRAFVQALEAWVIAALGEFNIKGEIRPGRVGVWVARPEKPPLPDGTPREDKIAAIGVRLSKWVSTHGLAINHDPICRISTASCLAASRVMGSPALWIWAYLSRWMTSTWRWSAVFTRYSRKHCPDRTAVCRCKGYFDCALI